jgi:hypothetical protein
MIVRIDPRFEHFAEPETFVISKRGNGQVQWVAAEGVRFTVEFEGESPFYESQFSDESPYSGIIRRNVLGDRKKTYTYNVRIENDQRFADPGGIIDR